MKKLLLIIPFMVGCSDNPHQKLPETTSTGKIVRNPGDWSDCLVQDVEIGGKHYIVVTTSVGVAICSVADQQINVSITNSTQRPIAVEWENKR